MGYNGTSEKRRELTSSDPDLLASDADVLASDADVLASDSALRASDPALHAPNDQRVLRDVDRKLRKKSLIRAIPELLLNVGTLYKMVRDKTFSLTWQTRGLVIGGLVYFLLPTDATPDYIPGIGFLDDTIVIGLIMKRLASEIDRYKQHITTFLDAAV